MDHEWPSVAVLIITYDRPKEVRATIRTLQRRLRYDGPLRWHLADDGSPAEYAICVQRDFPELAMSISITPRLGWAGNVNAGMRVCAQHDFVFVIEDDYIAKRDLDITRGVAVLQSVPDIGLIRYDGVDGHILNMELREATTAIGQVGYLRIEKDSPSLNVYSHRPHLKARRFHEIYGMYPEGLSLGATEESFAHRVKDQKGPDLACLAEGIPCAFDHIGRSRQGTKEDVHG